MTDVRISIAIHFTWDPVKQGFVIPDEVTKTIAIGDKIIPEKVSGSLINAATRTVIFDEMKVIAAKANKKAAKKAPEPVKPEAAKEEGTTGDLFGGGNDN